MTLTHQRTELELLRLTLSNERRAESRRLDLLTELRKQLNWHEQRQAEGVERIEGLEKRIERLEKTNGIHDD